MAVNEKHPEWTKVSPDWTLLHDSFEGERTIKEKGMVYLAPTAGQNFDGMNPGGVGLKAYEAYKMRARYPEHVASAVETAIGMMHHNPPKITLPEKLKYLLERATLRNENLEQLLRRVNEQQLIYGRVGLLLSIPKTGPDNPYISLYEGSSIINWDSGRINDLSDERLNLVVLNESGKIRKKDLTWQDIEQYRVLVLGTLEANEPVGTYSFAIADNDTRGLETPTSFQAVSYRGKLLDKIPFVFINTTDLLPSPVKPPLLGLANLCLTIYRGEADYRQNLFMQGQDTLVIVGGANGSDGDSIRVGAGASIGVPMGGDAKYIGVQSSGLAEQREALSNDNQLAGSMGAQSIDTTSRERESGSALQTRVSARTASLNQIAMTAAKGLEAILKIAAEWIGADPKEVEVIPNLDFGDEPLTGQELSNLQAAKNEGAPISGRSIHTMLVDKRMTNMTYEEELEELEKEAGGILDKAAQKLEADQALAEAAAKSKAENAPPGTGKPPAKKAPSSKNTGGGTPPKK